MLDSKRRFNQQRRSSSIFDHDCREGICGSCSLYINGEAHGPDRRVPTCQLHMRMFKDGDTIFIEPLEKASSNQRFSGRQKCI
jgi:succinate dehydrogenase/fumarate reductase-like Fe-S protein